MLSKMIGTLQKIPLQNIGGDGVFGIYNAVYPFYVLLVVVASAGIPVAVARLIAECEATGDETGSNRVLYASCLLMSITGLIGFLALTWGAETVASWIGNRHTVPAIRSSAYALLVMPLGAALRGYDQGRGRMESTAASQVAEQTGRVGIMIALLLYYVSREAPEETIAAGATFGSFAGGVCGLAAMACFRWKERRSAASATRAISAASAPAASPTIGGWMWRLARTALPICLGAIVMPAVNVVDVFTVPRLLARSGLGEAGALAEFGVYSRAFPLVQLATMVASSLAVGLVPSVADAARRDAGELRELLASALRWTWLIGWATATGLIALAEPINVALYTNATGMAAFVWIASTAVSGMLQAVTAPLLQGIGAVRAPALILLFAAGVKAAINLWLVPAYGIAGAAMSSAASLALAAALNAAALSRASGVRYAAWGARTARLALALAVMAAAARLPALAPAALGLGVRTGALLAVAGGVPLGALVFAGLALRLGFVRPHELAALPRIGPALIRIAAKIVPRNR
ncbi:membrane protein [Paenibacillus popilliae ATCC 14706]|uniref:Membrane protein n=1 Tax=Paenibacillus popilliae ATCC 14706 TaxID=1212764 RepID=M9LPH6_PAEPP|nr:membrane protein [Paenibacillus popilliae ATCC 14706]